MNIGSNVGNYTVFALSGHLLPCTGFERQVQTGNPIGQGGTLQGADLEAQRTQLLHCERDKLGKADSHAAMPLEYSVPAGV